MRNVNVYVNLVLFYPVFLQVIIFCQIFLLQLLKLFNADYNINVFRFLPSCPEINCPSPNQHKLIFFPDFLEQDPAFLCQHGIPILNHKPSLLSNSCTNSLAYHSFKFHRSTKSCAIGILSYLSKRLSFFSAKKLAGSIPTIISLLNLFFICSTPWASAYTYTSE